MAPLRAGILGEEMSSEEAEEGERVRMLGAESSSHGKMEQRRSQEETEEL